MGVWKSVWERHWAWMLAVGSLGVLLGCVGLGLWLADVIAGPEEAPRGPEELALERARQSPQVRAALGEPIAPRVGDFTQGSGEGFSTFGGRIELEGPRGQGQLRVEAVHSRGRWRFDTLQVALAHGTVDLLAPPANTVPHEKGAAEGEKAPTPTAP